MASEVTVDVRIIGQPECCKKYKQAGWKFTYQPGTKFVQADHPLGGKQSVVEVIDIGRNGYECDDDGRRCDAKLAVMVDQQGDVYVSMHAYHDEDRATENLNPFPVVRMRTGIGGGRNRRTRQALLWLAKAIELDAQSTEGIFG